MKKTMTIALAFASLMAGNAAKKAIVVDNTQTIKKEITSEPKRRKKNQAKPVLEPTFPDFDSIYTAQPNPIWMPTRSQRIKNKLNRKYYS